MLTLITSSGSVPLRVYDYYVKELASGLDELCFSISIWDEQYQAIQEESSIFEQSDGKSAYYLVKAIDGGAESANVKCQIDLDEWRGTFNLSYDSGTASIGDIVNAVKPTGWTVVNNSGIIYRRTVRLEGVTAHDVIEKCRSTFPGVTYRFDNVNKVVEIINANEGPNLGAFATRELNLKKNEYKGKSTGFATRLYAYGKDGMSFADINGGNPYVENHEYSPRVICAYWTDERYTIPQNLLADAQAKVDEMARPQRSFDCDVVDLAKTNPAKYSELDFQLFSIVGLIDQTRANQKINHQIVELWRYPYEPQKNKVVLSTVAPRIQSQVTQVYQSINNVNSEWSQQQAAYFNVLTAALLGAKGGSVRLLDTDGDGEPDTLYIADSPDPENAQMVWRFNFQGWGASQNGYNGPFQLGATFDDGGTLYANILKVMNINADNITTGTINADSINVTNINGQNIKDKTIGSSPIADSAVIERTIGGSAVTEGKIGSLAVTNGKIGNSAVSYGKTSFTSTLDQVAINTSDIAALQRGYFGALACTSLVIGNWQIVITSGGAVYAVEA